MHCTLYYTRVLQIGHGRLEPSPNTASCNALSMHRAMQYAMQYVMHDAMHRAMRYAMQYVMHDAMHRAMRYVMHDAMHRAMHTVQWAVQRTRGAPRVEGHRPSACVSP